MAIEKSNFKVIIQDGKAYPFIERPKGTMKIEECPYCGESHEHGLGGGGHSLSHCLDRHEPQDIIIEGIEIPYGRGYFIYDI